MKTFLSLAALAAAAEAMVTVNKCCQVDSLLLEVSAGVRRCQEPDEDASNSRWQPIFFDLDTGVEAERPKGYELRQAMPECDEQAGEVLWPVYHHERTSDDLMLGANGTLMHR